MIYKFLSLSCSCRSVLKSLWDDLTVKDLTTEWIRSITFLATSRVSTFTKLCVRLVFLITFEILREDYEDSDLESSIWEGYNSLLLLSFSVNYCYEVSSSTITLTAGISTEYFCSSRIGNAISIALEMMLSAINSTCGPKT